MVAVTRELAAFVAGLRYESLPANVQERTRFLILDLVGNMLRGRHEAESTPPLLAAARALGLTGGSAAVFGDSQRYTPAGAALINGAMAHSLDFDDTHAAGTLHPGAPVAAHPECPPFIVDHADYVGSTSGILNFAKTMGGDTLIVAPAFIAEPRHIEEITGKIREALVAAG